MVVGSFNIQVPVSSDKDRNLMTANSFVTDIYLRPQPSMIKFAQEQNLPVHPTHIFMSILPYLAKELGLTRDEVINESKSDLAYICMNNIHIRRWAEIGVTL